MSCNASKVYDTWSSTLTTNTSTTPNGCNPTADKSCSSTSPLNAALSTPMITTYVVFGAILVALILFLSLNAATIHKAKAKSARHEDAHTNLGLSYK